MKVYSEESLYKNMPIGLAVLQLDEKGYHTLYINQTITGKYGLTREEFSEVINNDGQPFIHPSDQDRLSLMLYKSGVTGGKFTEILRLRQKDGTYSWTDFRINAIPDDKGSYVLYLALIDIDTQKEMSLKIEHTYENLLGVMNNTPGGILVFDTKNDREPLMTFASSGLYHLLEGTPEEINAAYTRDFYKAVHPGDREAFIRTMEDALRNLSRFQITLRLQTIPGDFRWVDASGTAVIVEGQRRIYMSVTNASPDKEARQLLKRILDMFVRQQYDNICLIDGASHAFRVLTSNNTPYSRIPLESDDYDREVRKLLEFYIAPEEREALWKQLNLASLLQAMETQEEVEIFVTIHMPPHQELRYKKFWVTWLDKPAKKMAFIQSDYTELRKKQIEHQKTLISALRAAEQANVAKSVFLSRMSHDIRTPLNAIIGFTNMCLTDDKATREMKERLCKIESASQFLLSLINDVLDMSRIESGKYSLQLQSFRLSSLIDGVSSIISAQCTDKDLSLHCSISENAQNSYIGDRLKIQQVLVNILGNAVKFTPAGGSVTLLAEEQAAFEHTALLRFTVTDTGVGISPEFIPHLFDAFTQENTHTSGHIGTGLGLAICKNIVTLMNGTIQVHSTKGKGSCFITEIQLDRSAASAAPDPIEDSRQATPAILQNFKGLHILVAEDHPMNQEIARYLLEKIGFIVDMADNGRIACEKFSASQEGYYAAVILDIRMPEMDGIEAARKIRTMDRHDAHTMPLIAMSADAFEEDISKSLANGINAHLIKPIDAAVLYRTLARYIPQKS